MDFYVVFLPALIAKFYAMYYGIYISLKHRPYFMIMDGVIECVLDFLIKVILFQVYVLYSR